jgi:hypothetical protein
MENSIRGDRLVTPGNTKGGSITVPLTSGLSCFENKNIMVSCHTADPKLVKQDINCTVILSPLVFPGYSQCK